jgi:hypothetical protein
VCRKARTGIFDMESDELFRSNAGANCSIVDSYIWGNVTVGDNCKVHRVCGAMFRHGAVSRAMWPNVMGFQHSKCGSMRNGFRVIAGDPVRQCCAV